MYGLDGDDRISGDGENDYADGGAGDDRVDGGRGNDTISGGRGDDTLRGGSGDDHIYTGRGRDTVDGERGTDTAYGQADDTLVAERVVIVELRAVGTTITIEGSPAFVDRVRADLDMLRASPRGQAMLAALDDGVRRSRSPWADVPVIGRLVNRGDTLTILEYVSSSRAEDNSFAHRDVERFRRGHQMLVEYQTDLDHAHGGPPISVLYHELAHVYDYVHDTMADGTYTGADNPGADNAERVAMGLPIDHDQDPSTPDQLDPRHPYDCTENALREEMGIRRAARY
jgi:hypothetical protein